MGNGCQTQNNTNTNKQIVKLYNCKIWSNVTENNFIFPENSEIIDSTAISSISSTSFSSLFSTKDEVGVALCGGGFRAASLALGFLRGLHLLNLLSKIKYISCNSGSSWVITPLSFYQGDINTFLDPYLPPEQCTGKNLRKCNPNGHSYALCKTKELEIILKHFLDGVMRVNPADYRGFWSQAIGQIFFKKYNLNVYNYLPTFSGSCEEEIIQRFGLSKSKLYSCDISKLPFLIINGSAVLQGKQLFTPVEFTPLYYGFPALFKYNDESHYNGGYYIEPFGFTSNPSSSISHDIKHKIIELSNMKSSEQDNNIVENKIHENNKNENNIDENNQNNNQNNILKTTEYLIGKIPKPSKYLSISELSGISSSAHTQVLGHAIDDSFAKMIDLSVYNIWNPKTGNTNPTIFCDGGGVENTGVHALIRRKIKKIILMIPTDQSLMDETIDHKNLSKSSFACIAGLFGVMTSDTKFTVDKLTAEDFNKSHQIFPSEDYPRLINLLKTRYFEGKPCSCLFETTVIPNPIVNIVGGFNVEILFIVNAPSDDWVNQLPNDIRKKVLLQRRDVDKQLKKSTKNDVEGEDDNDNNNEDNNDKDNNENKILEEVNEFIQQIPNKFEDDINQLKDFVKDMLKDSPLESFPYMPTMKADYSIQLVNLLSNLMCWEVIQSKDLLESLYGREINLNQNI